MGKHQNFPKRILCFLLAVMLLCSMALPALAAGSKNTKPRAISIVFDNSGSMYMNGSNVWCRAIYAMEVFAAMMNEGDVLEIHPMSPITVGDSPTAPEYTMDNPLVIDDFSKVPDIRQIFSPHAGDTPIEAVTAAYEGLNKYSGHEKWLVVVTDGNIFYENGNSLDYTTEERLSEMLSDYCQNVNIAYLGIGFAVEPTVTGSNQHLMEVASNSEDTLEKLTVLCNGIFGRDSLPMKDQKVGDKEIEFDLPMTKLIVFVQGQDISSVKLTNASGSEAGGVLREYSPKYSELGTDTYSNESVDKALQGTIITYTDVPKGAYSLSYTGTASKIHYYYEPDVDLKLTLTDENGNPVTGELTSGDYELNYSMVDNEGNPVDSPLLGETLFTITYYINGEPFTITDTKAGSVPLHLNADDVLDAEADVDYLKNYHIHLEGDDLGFPIGVVPNPVGDLVLTADGSVSEIGLSEVADHPGFPLSLTYEGLPLTAEQAAKVTFDVTVKDGNLSYEILPDGTDFLLVPKYAGSAAETDCGAYILEVTAHYLTEDALTATSNTATLKFNLNDDRLKLKAELKLPGYCQIGSVDNADIRVVLSQEGKPLTDEELNSIRLTVDAEGLTVTATPIPGESAFRLTVDNSVSIKAGFYDFLITAEGKDSVGDAISAQDKGTMELQHYPLWLRYLLLALLIALIAALIYAYMNTKILPKHIAVSGGSTSFMVDGSRVNGAARVEFTGKNQKAGSLTVKTPPYALEPLARGGFTLELVAVSPRKTKSPRRRIGVTAVSPINGAAVTTIKIGTVTYKKNDTGKFVRAGANPAPKPGGKKARGNTPVTLFESGHNAQCVITGETIDGKSFSCSCNLQYL